MALVGRSATVLRCAVSPSPPASAPPLPLSPSPGSAISRPRPRPRRSASSRSAAASASRSTSSSPPGDARRFVVEKTGRVRLSAERPPRHRRARSALDRSRAAASRACSGRVPPATTRQNGRFFVDYTDRHGDTRVVELPALARRARRPADAARRVLLSRPAVREPQRRPARVRPRRLALHRHGRRRRRRRPARNGQNLEHAARQDAAHRRRRARTGKPYAIPRDNPFVGTAGARRRSGLRAAQPVALLVRPRRPATSGSATSARARGRRSTSSRAGRGRGVNFGWNVMEGTHCFEAATPLRPASLTRAGGRVRPRRRAAR